MTDCVFVAGSDLREFSTGGIRGAVSEDGQYLRVLDKVCEYYGRYEPSSPVPVLVRRAQRLVSKSFMEIIQDLSPDSVRQIEVISGPTEESQQ